MRAGLAAGRRSLLTLGAAGVLGGVLGGRALLPAAGGALPTVAAAAPAAGPTPSAAAGAVTADGTAVQMRYGTVQVRLTATRTGGVLRITSATALQLPSGRSQRYSDYAGPALAREAVAAGNAKIDTVSGATYTSTAYRASLQAALDALPAA